MKLLRYFSTYRWELWLIIGIPIVSAEVSRVSAPLLTIPLFDLAGITNVVSYSIPISAAHLVIGIVSLPLLSVSYLRVRRLERELLASLWRYSIAVAVIGIVAATAVIVVEVADFEASRTVISIGATGTSLFASLLQYLALLWFARQLSRISLTHAFFLVAFTSLYLFIPIQGSLVTSDGARAINLYILVNWIVGLIVMLIRVWLLGNFDRRGDRFRKEAIIILVATVILSQYASVTIGGLLGYLEIPSEAILPFLGATVGLFMVVGLVFNLVTLLALFGVVYLIRVRQPKTGAPPVPANNR